MNILKRQLIIVFLGLLLLPWHASAFVSELWPEEGRPVFRSKVEVLLLHERPSVKSKIKKQQIKKRSLITFDETRYRNVRSGAIKVLRDISIQGRDFGTLKYLTSKHYYSDIPDRVFVVKHGDIIEYLQERAEGSCLVRCKGRVIELESCPFGETTEEYQIISKPVNEWWVRVVMNKKPIGWLLIDDKVVDEDREF